MANTLFGQTSDPEKWVYHYTSMDTGLTAILLNGTLKLGLFKDVNDPRESKAYNFTFNATNGLNPNTGEIAQLTNQATVTIKNHSKLLCMSRDDPRVVNQEADYFFHRGFSRPRMWAQYGDSHQGVCLVFDRHALDKQIRAKLNNNFTIYSNSVRYVNLEADNISAFNLDYQEILEKSFETVIRRKLETHYSTYFFKKAEDWSNEIEWRWVALGGKHEPEFIPFGASLKAIILGAEFQHVYKPAVAPFAEQYDIQVAQIHWNNGKPIITPAF